MALILETLTLGLEWFSQTVSHTLVVHTLGIALLAQTQMGRLAAQA
jgi:hypothetical protein